MTPTAETRRRITAALLGRAAEKWSLAAGGLSGASVWRVVADGDPFAVRRWPPAYRLERVAWITRTVTGLFQAGCGFVPSPVVPPSGASPVDDGGALWDAAPWIDGRPLSPQATDEQLDAALAGLASLHRAAAGVPRADPAPAIGIEDRLARLAGIPTKRPTPASIEKLADFAELPEIASRLAAAAAAATSRLAPYRERAPAGQVVHGDARPEHFLLRGSSLAGVIDFGALRWDCVEADVARFAGELAPGDAPRRDAIVRAYASHAGPIDARLVAAIDLAGAVIAADNWLTWIASGATASNPRAVRERLRSSLLRMPAV